MSKTSTSTETRSKLLDAAMPGQDWERIGSVRLHDLDEVRAEITGFTRYALAGGT